MYDSELEPLLRQIKDPDTQAWIAYMASRLNKQDIVLQGIAEMPARQFKAREVALLQEWLLSTDRRAVAQTETDTDETARKQAETGEHRWDLIRTGLQMAAAGLTGYLSSALAGHFK